MLNGDRRNVSDMVKGCILPNLLKEKGRIAMDKIWPIVDVGNYCVDVREAETVDRLQSLAATGIESARLGSLSLDERIQLLNCAQQALFRAMRDAGETPALASLETKIREARASLVPKPLMSTSSYCAEVRKAVSPDQLEALAATGIEHASAGTLGVSDRIQALNCAQQALFRAMQEVGVTPSLAALEATTKEVRSFLVPQRATAIPATSPNVDAYAYLSQPLTPEQLQLRQRRQAREQGEQQALKGLGCGLLALIVFGVTYFAAQSSPTGGTVVIPRGAFLVAAIMVIGGVLAMVRNSD